jgi:hypothetical protein
MPDVVISSAFNLQQETLWRIPPKAINGRR